MIYQNWKKYCKAKQFVFERNYLNLDFKFGLMIFFSIISSRCILILIFSMQQSRKLTNKKENVFRLIWN